MSDSVRPYGQQPTRLLHPQDSLGKNTGVGCHFLLQVYNIVGLDSGYQKQGEMEIGGATTKSTHRGKQSLMRVDLRVCIWGQDPFLFFLNNEMSLSCDSF